MSTSGGRPLPEGNDRDGAGADEDPLEVVKWRAQGVGDGGLDRIGVGKADDDTVWVGFADPLERPNHPVLHFREALPAGKA